jgi:hypothetical protein
MAGDVDFANDPIKACIGVLGAKEANRTEPFNRLPETLPLELFSERLPLAFKLSASNRALLKGRHKLRRVIRVNGQLARGSLRHLFVKVARAAE